MELNKEDLYEIVFVLHKNDNLEFYEIASALNMKIETVKRIYNLTKRGRVGKIDYDKFVSMWKKGVPYEVMSNYFGVAKSTIAHYKSNRCRNIKRKAVCVNCGTIFETTLYNKQNCDACLFESRQAYFAKQRWIKKIQKGTEIKRKRREKEFMKEERERKKRKEKYGY